MERRKPTVFELLPYGKAVDVGYADPKKRSQEVNTLCEHCMFAKSSCQNSFNREVRVKMDPDDPPEIEILTMRLKGFRINEIIYKPTGFKLVDGVEAGIYTSEEDIPNADRCGWFEPNSVK